MEHYLVNLIQNFHRKSSVLTLSEAIKQVKPVNGSLMLHNYKINVDLLYS